MTAQLCSRRRVAALHVGISAVALMLIIGTRERAIAAPVVAQAYGTACFTQMPMVKAFGRYILDDDDAAVLAEVNDARRGRLPNVDADMHNYALDHVGGRRDTKSANATGVNPVADAHDYSRGAHEVGVFGETGALGFSGSAFIPGTRVDSYNVATPDIKNGPRSGPPNVGCEYASATHSNFEYLSPRIASNAIQPDGSTVGSWRIGSARQMVDHDRRTVNFTYYQANEELGAFGVARLVPTGAQTGGGAGFAYAINPYTRFYTTVSLQKQRPALSVIMQFTPPLWSHPK